MTLLSTEARLAKERKRSKDESMSTSNRDFKFIMKIIATYRYFWLELPLYTNRISASGLETSSSYKLICYSNLLKLSPNYEPTIV